jgi:hypothetical protein
MPSFEEYILKIYKEMQLQNFSDGWTDILARQNKYVFPPRKT